MPTARQATEAEPTAPAGVRVHGVADAAAGERPVGPPRASGTERGGRWPRLVAAGLGLLAAALAVAVPLLPVVQHTASISWPAGGRIEDVSAPLTAFQPAALRASVPCEAARSTQGRLFSTVPPDSPLGAGVGMTLASDRTRVVLTSRGRELGATTLPAGDCTIGVASDPRRTTLAVTGTRPTEVDGDVRPQVVGVYSELFGSAPDGLRLEIDVDTRFDTSPHPFKIAIAALAVLAAIGSLVALHRLDVRTGRNAPRMLPRNWWRPSLRDAVVVGVLAVWLVIGAITSDDGYILAIARAREDAGYIGNYYRWFNVPEAPFGWFYELYALMVQVSTSPPWLRLPAFGLGVLSWWLISREVLPRLGREVRRSHAAGWAAAAVFLCWWLPYNNGMRPEPVAAAGSLLTLCLVERTIATRRLVPAGLGLVVAGLTVTATPTGLIAVVPFLVAVRPLVALLRARARDGWLVLFGPIAGCGLLPLVAVFADQSVAAVLEATRVRTFIGPSMSWFEEPFRYLQLLNPGRDGALGRRFPLLVLLLCVATCLVVLLRRGRIPGAALGPSRRLIGLAAWSLAIIALTPTKWTHHFGAFVAIGAALAALTALATSGSVLRSRRNRAAFVGALLALLAFSFTASNAWWYVSGLGVPWFDKTPSIRGFELSSVLMFAAAVAFAVAAVEHLRLPAPGTPGARAAERPERRIRALRFGSAPLAIICGLVVLFEVASLAKGMHKQRDSYSVGAANVAALAGQGCGLADRMLVEPRPADGMLPQASDQATMTGFAPGAAPPGVANSDAGRRLPYGLGSVDAPVWGSFLDGGQTTGDLRTGWYELPEAARSGAAPVVVTVGGQIDSGNSVRLEFGRRTGGTVAPVDQVEFEDVIDPTRDTDGDWRELRLGLAGRPAAGADVVRLVAADRNLSPEGWLAVSPPRVPHLISVRELVGDGPVYLQWPVPLVYPCLRPFAVRGGVAEVPAYLIAPDHVGQGSADGWAAPADGGTQGYLDVLLRRRQLPAYLDGTWSGDWGRVYALDEFNPARPAELVRGEQPRSAMWSPGPMLVERPDTRDSGTTR